MLRAFSVKIHFSSRFPSLRHENFGPSFFAFVMFLLYWGVSKEMFLPSSHIHALIRCKRKQRYHSSASKASFVYSCRQTKQIGQYYGKWPISLVYVCAKTFVNRYRDCSNSYWTVCAAVIITIYLALMTKLYKRKVELLLYLPVELLTSENIPPATISR